MQSCIKTEKREVIRVVHFGGAAIIKIFDEIVEEWQAHQTNVKITLEAVPWGQYMDKLLTGIAGGSGADVAWIENKHMPPLYEKGGLLPLNEFIEHDDSISVADYWFAIIDRFTQNGKIYCLPNDVAPVAVIYYNKGLFDRAGLDYPDDNWDWNDFLRTAKKLTIRDTDGQIEQFGFYSDNWQNWVYSVGGRIVDSVKKPFDCVLNTSEAIKGLEFFYNLALKHKVMPSFSEREGTAGMNEKQMFMTGKIAMINSGIWHSLDFAEIKDFDWDIAMFPRAPGKKHPWLSTGGSGGVS